MAVTVILKDARSISVGEADSVDVAGSFPENVPASWRSSTSPFNCVSTRGGERKVLAQFALSEVVGYVIE